MSETEAIHLAQSGDSEAIGVLYALHRANVFRTCLQMLKNPSEAEDLTQDVFVLVLTKIKQFNGLSSFSTWLHRIATRKVLMYLRGNKFRNHVGGDIPELYALPDQLVRLEFEDTMKHLNESDRELMDKRREGYKIRELGPNPFRSGRRVRQIHTQLRGQLA